MPIRAPFGGGSRPRELHCPAPTGILMPAIYAATIEPTRNTVEGTVPDDLITALQRARQAEKEQALYYRSLAAAAEANGDAALGERFNELHADEQHHLSRLTARLLELGATPADLPQRGEAAALEGWEEVARRREDAEVERYEALVATHGVDAQTGALLREMLDTERHHAAELGGKWTVA
jgi:rubrerythrin